MRKTWRPPASRSWLPGPRGGQGVAAGSEQLLASGTEAATGLVGMSARAETSASTVAEVSATAEEMAKGIERLAADARDVGSRVTTVAGNTAGIARGVEGSAVCGGGR